MIELKNIHKTFDDREILKGISTVFEKGKTNLIIGQSGSGKTVLMKCIVGLFEPTVKCSMTAETFSECQKKSELFCVVKWE